MVESNTVISAYTKYGHSSIENFLHLAVEVYFQPMKNYYLCIL